MKNIELFKKGAENLIEERVNYKNMRGIAKAAAEEFDIDIKKLMALKDYKHYYGMDWSTNPLEPFKEAEWRCRLSQPFRSVVKVINNLRDTKHLDMLEDIQNALSAIGIHLTIDDTFMMTEDQKKSLDSIIETMDSYQTNICELADERKEFRKNAVETKVATQKSYNEYVSAMVKLETAKDPTKALDEVNEKTQELLLETGIDQEVFTAIIEEVN